MSFYNLIFVSLLFITKNKAMKISPDSTLGEVVKGNFNTAAVFQANNMDFCCGGSINIADACSKAGIDAGQLIARLEAAAAQTDPDSEYINSLEPDELCTYIIKRHHEYVRKNIPLLTKNLEKICQVHGEHHPELYKIRDLFTQSAGNLTMHMQKEEIMLFPYIQRLARAKRDHAALAGSPFGSVSNPIGAMVAEHQAEGERFDEIAKLSGNYQLPGDACATFEVTYQQLKGFEDDLHRHIHLENNILFPKAIELENH